METLTSLAERPRGLICSFSAVRQARDRGGQGNSQEGQHCEGQRRDIRRIVISCPWQVVGGYELRHKSQARQKLSQ